MIRQMLELGNPLLRQVAAVVDDPQDPSVHEVLRDLRDTLADFRHRNGWGRALSAPIIGVPLRIILIEYDERSMVLINPVFEQWSSDQESVYESCITFPSLWGMVSRPVQVVVQALDEAGIPHRWEASGPFGRTLQHEIDHLDGLIWLDREPDIDSICTTTEYKRRQASHQSDDTATHG
jgi:peptide deformylase